MKDKNEREVGLIAQEVEKVLPEAVVNWDEKTDYKSVLYDKLVPLRAGDTCSWQVKV